MTNLVRVGPLFQSEIMHQFSGDPIWGMILAVFSAMCYGVSAVFIRLGLRSLTPINASILSLATSLAVVLIMSLILEQKALFSISFPAFLVFGACGIIAFAFGRYFNYAGIKYVGATRSVTLRSISPFFATLLAVLFLGEAPSISVILGTIFIVAGVWIVVNSSYE